MKRFKAFFLTTLMLNSIFIFSSASIFHQERTVFSKFLTWAKNGILEIKDNIRTQRKWNENFRSEQFRKSIIAGDLKSVNNALNYFWSPIKDPNIIVDSFFSFTALHQAAHSGQLDVAKLLVEAGADPSRTANKYFEFMTADQLASMKGHKELASYLKEISRRKKILASLSR